MALSREAKTQTVAELVDSLSHLKLAVLTDYRGLTVAELDELRAALRAEQIPYRIAKNSLLKLAIAQTPAFKELDPSIFTGPIALAVDDADEANAARIIDRFGRTHEALQATGGLTAEGQFIDAAAVKALANLPTRDQLVATVVGTVAAPLTGLVGVMAANLRNLVNVINAISELNQEGA